VTQTPAGDRPVVAVLTLGCKLNQSDSETIARRLAGEGVHVVDRPVRGASAFVVNSCSVTHVADRKARHLVRMARRLSPGAQIVLTGCYAETAPADIGRLTGADIVLRNVDKPAIPDLILERLAGRGDPAAGCPTPVRNPLRTRAFIKIQEGCNELCAFCIVPYTRGREESVPIADVVRQVQAREAGGVLAGLDDRTVAVDMSTVLPATIQGRRRPHRVTVRSLSQPTRMGVSSAKTPPAAVTRPISRSAREPAMRVAPTGIREM